MAQPEKKQKDDEDRFNETLRRMLKTPPQPKRDTSGTPEPSEKDKDERAGRER